MEKQLVYVSSKCPDRSSVEISKYLESYFGFERSCPQEIIEDANKTGGYAGFYAPTISRISLGQALIEAKEALEKGKNAVLDIWADVYTGPNEVNETLVEPFEDDNLQKSFILIASRPEISFERYLDRAEKKGRIYRKNPNFKEFRERILEDFKRYSQDKPYVQEFTEAGYETINYDLDSDEDLVSIKADLDRRFSAFRSDTPAENRPMIATRHWPISFTRLKDIKIR